MTEKPSPNQAREAAEKIVDGLLTLSREDLAHVPSEDRFEYMVGNLLRINISDVVLASGLVAAVERLLTKEKLDHDLSPER